MADKYRLNPCLHNATKRWWQVQYMYSTGGTDENWTTIAWVATIKGGKAIIAHLRRKPIAVE